MPNRPSSRAPNNSSPSIKPRNFRWSRSPIAVNTSKFYFCKMFKKATGINFTDYLSRVRTERAKNLLLNPNLRVSEIAYEVGFQSLTHFNRVFKRILGRSPTDYREQLARHEPPFSFRVSRRRNLLPSG